MSARRLVSKALCVAILVAASGLAMQAAEPAAAAEKPKPVEVRIGILSVKSPPPALYEIDPVPPDEALVGARLAIADNSTTGAFTGQHYSLDEAVVDKGQSAADVARKLVEGGDTYLIVNLPADDVLGIADALKD